MTCRTVVLTMWRMYLWSRYILQYGSLLFNQSSRHSDLQLRWKSFSAKSFRPASLGVGLEYSVTRSLCLVITVTPTGSFCFSQRFTLPVQYPVHNRCVPLFSFSTLEVTPLFYFITYVFTHF
eukprot:g22573.t1